MQHHHVHHLVVTARCAIVGIVSAGDLNRLETRPDAPVQEVMNRDVVTVAAGATIRTLANALRGHGTGCAIVMEHGRAAGIITASDLLEVLGRGEVHPTRHTKRPDLRYKTPHQHKRTATGVW
jgi:CBS domain-containing protein